MQTTYNVYEIGFLKIHRRLFKVANLKILVRATRYTCTCTCTLFCTTVHCIYIVLVQYENMCVLYRILFLRLSIASESESILCTVHSVQYRSIFNGMKTHISSNTVHVKLKILCSLFKKLLYVMNVNFNGISTCITQYCTPVVLNLGYSCHL